MNLSLDQKLRVVSTYLKNKQSCKKRRFEALKILAANQSIHASTLTMRNFINKWIRYGKFKIKIKKFLN